MSRTLTNTNHANVAQGDWDIGRAAPYHGCTAAKSSLWTNECLYSNYMVVQRVDFESRYDRFGFRAI